MIYSAKEIIEQLQLLPHPEGGYYRETYRSVETTINVNGVTRNVCTAIYFLLENEDKSYFHRIQSDELWFFHQGQALEILMIINNKIQSIFLGNNLANGEVLFCKIPAKTWFAAKLKSAKGYALVSCTVSPGFDFKDFELAKREKLIAEYPTIGEVIKEFTTN